MMSHLDVARVLLETGGLDVHECACWQGGYQIAKAELQGEVQDLQVENEALRTALASTRAELADALKPSVQDTVPNTATPANLDTAFPTSTSSPPAPPVATPKPTSTPEEREEAYEESLRQVIGINHRPLTGEEKQQARTLREKQGPNAAGPSRRGGLFGFLKG